MSSLENLLMSSRPNWVEAMLAEAWQIALGAQSSGISAERYATFQAKYFDNPAGFVQDCFLWVEGEGPTSYQVEVLEAAHTHKRISVRGPHGLGKTALMAWFILWFALTRDGKDWKVVTTASAWRQLIKFLWPEVYKWSRGLDWAKIGREPFSPTEIRLLSLRLGTGEAFAVASDNPALIEGAHAEYILYIFDESKAIIPATFDAAEGALTTPGAMAIAMSTPGAPQGRFYEIQSRKQGYQDWWVRHVTKDEVIKAGRMTEEWAEARKKQWGANSTVYKNRVEGEFAASDEDSVISLEMIERANKRWEHLEESGNWEKFICLGADIARAGEDKTVFALRFGWAIKELMEFSKEDTMQITGRVEGLLSLYDGAAIVDTIGVGAGVYDRLRELGHVVTPFTASAGTKMMDKKGVYGFSNVRSAAWWNLRELLEDDLIALPPNDILTGDLTAPKWVIMSGARIRIEAKEDIKERIGRSTDYGDSVVMAFWEGLQVTETAENPLSGYRG